MPTPSSPGLKIDAYLRWALQTGFRYYDTRSSNQTVLLVRFDQPLDDTRHKRAMGAGLWVCPFYIGHRFATVRASITDLPRLLAELEGLGAQYCELGAPVAPPSAQDVLITPRSDKPGPATVIGIVDDGCPFAHQAYRRSDPSSPRVRYIWDQGDSSGAGGLPPLPFNYGRSYDDAMLQDILARASSNGVVDEDAAYGLTALPSLRGALSHGAQVISHAAGFARKIEGRAPPKPLVGRTDLVFVQLPPDALDDPSGKWLDHFGVDGLVAVHFYGREVHATPAQKIVVNLSYGPQTGPHDGSSYLEFVIDQMNTAARDAGYEFHVVLPTGNNHLLRAHAEFDLERGGGTIDWFVAADSQLPSMLEIWLPPGVALDEVVVGVDSPWAEHIEATPPSPGQESETNPVQVTVGDEGPPTGCTQVMIAVAPTARPAHDSSAAFEPGTPGRWRITVQPRAGHSPKGIAHAYLARNNANMGRARLGRSGYLYSPGYAPACPAPADEQLEVNREYAPAEVVARGSVSGIATGRYSRVAAGYRLSDRLPAPYSAGGPSRGARGGPDWAYPAEQSRVLSGLLAAGNRSATVLRLTGTSIAAPQFARDLAAAPLGTLPPYAPSAPAGPAPAPPPWLAERAGKGLR